MTETKQETWRFDKTINISYLVIFVVAIGGFVSWYSQWRNDISNVLATHSVQIEALQDSTKSYKNETNERLVRIEDKLDRIIEGKFHGSK